MNFALAEIDLDYVAEVRASMPVRLQRRPDLYGELRLQDKIPCKCDSFFAPLSKATFMLCSVLMSFYPAKFWVFSCLFSVADPHLFHCGFAPAFYLNANPDPAPGSQTITDPDPAAGSQTNADPDLVQTFPSQKVEFLLENIVYVGNMS